MYARALLTALLVATAFAGCLENPLQPDPGPGPQAEPSDDGARPSPDPSQPPGSEENISEAPREQPGAPGAEAWQWPDRASATIRPGVQMVADGSQCTSNFVFLDPWNTTVYLGFAAHCVAEGASTNSNGCDPANAPFEVGTPVEIDGASKPGTLVYTSWGTMQEAGDAGDAACQYNDFAVVELHPDDYAKAHPAMLGFGGPTGIADPATVDAGEKVLSFGATGLRPRFDTTDAREGYVLATGGDGWTTTAYILTPGLPGDSGSGVLSGDGLALGILVTVGLTPYPASNGITSLYPAMLYAADHGLPLRLGTSSLDTSGMLPPLG